MPCAMSVTVHESQMSVVVSVYRYAANVLALGAHCTLLWDEITVSDFSADPLMSAISMTTYRIIDYWYHSII